MIGAFLDPNWIMIEFVLLGLIFVAGRLGGAVELVGGFLSSCDRLEYVGMGAVGAHCQNMDGGGTGSSLSLGKCMALDTKTGTVYWKDGWV